MYVRVVAIQLRPPLWLPRAVPEGSWNYAPGRGGLKVHARIGLRGKLDPSAYFPAKPSNLVAVPRGYHCGFLGRVLPAHRLHCSPVFSIVLTG